MEGAAVFLLIPLAVGLTVVLVRWKNGRTRKFVTEYLAQQQIDGEVTDGWMPPLRLWLKNRKGDGWCRIRVGEDQFRWVRVRNTLFSGTQVEFFE